VGLEFIHSTRACLFHVEAGDKFLLQSMRSNLSDSISYFEVAILDLGDFDVAVTTVCSLVDYAVTLAMLVVITLSDAILSAIDR